MSEPSWTVHLNQTLKRLKTSDSPVRTAILGIGNELHGDDAAGVIIARELYTLCAPAVHLLIIEAGSAPENHTGALRQFQPDLVLLIDTAQMDCSAGTVRWLDWRNTTGISASTHTLPLHVFARYLCDEFSCEVALIGLQPASNTLFASLSNSAQQAVNTLVHALASELLS